MASCKLNDYDVKKGKKKKRCQKVIIQRKDDKDLYNTSVGVEGMSGSKIKSI